MKYIIFEDKKTKLLQPVIFGEHTTHSQISIEGAKPISAGFVYIMRNGIEVKGNSESLNLTPLEGDKMLLEFVITDMGTMFFMQIDTL